MFEFKLHIPAAGLIGGILGLFLAGVSQATPLSSATSLESYEAVGDWKVEGRIGGRSTWELGLGSNTQASGQFDETHIRWQQGVTESFALSWAEDTVSFTLGGKTVSWQSAWVDFNVLRVKAMMHGASSKLAAGTSLAIADLTLNGMAPATDGLSLTAGSSWQESRLYLYQDAAFEALELSGNLTFDWPEGAMDPWQRNAQSRITFFFETGTVPVGEGFSLSGLSEGEVPVPPLFALMALVGAAMLRGGRTA